MPPPPETEALLRDLAKRPANHDNIKAAFKELLVREFGMDRGARDFDKVMFNLPIPLFDATDPLHRELAEAGALAEEVAGDAILVEGEKFQRARKRVRDALAEDGIGGEIEKLVEKLLGPA